MIPCSCILIEIYNWYFSYLQVCFAGSCIISWRLNADDSVSMCHYGWNLK